MRAALLVYPHFTYIIYNRRRDARELEQKHLFVGVSHEIRERASPVCANRDATEESWRFLRTTTVLKYP